jgi:hypothetical protein
VENEQLAHAVDGVEELRQKCFKGGGVVLAAQCFGPDVASTVFGLSPDKAELAQVA